MKAGCALRAGTKFFSTPQVYFRGADREPTAAARRQHRRLRLFAHAENAAIKGAGFLAHARPASRSECDRYWRTGMTNYACTE